MDVVNASGKFDEAVRWACSQYVPKHIRWQLAYKACELGNLEAFENLRNAIFQERETLASNEEASPTDLEYWDKKFEAFHKQWLTAAIHHNRGNIVSRIMSEKFEMRNPLFDTIMLCVNSDRPSLAFDPYVLAARYGASKVIKSLYARGLRYEDDGGNSSYIGTGFRNSALFHAVQRNDIDLLQLLLRLRGVQEHPWEFTQSNQLGERREPIFKGSITFHATEAQWREAATDDKMNFTSCLDQLTFAPDSDAFCLACLSGDYDIISILLPLVRKHLQKHPTDPRPILSSFSSALILNRAIMYAALGDNERLVKTLLKETGTDINQSHFIPHLAVLDLIVLNDPYYEGHYAYLNRNPINSGLERWSLPQARRALEILTQNGADMKALDRSGKSAWHYIITSHQEPGIVSLAQDYLIKGEVPVDTVDQSGETPLHALVQRVTKPTNETMKLLAMLINPTTVNIPNKKGNLPIDWARHGAIIIELLKNSPDINHVTNSGKPWGINHLEQGIEGLKSNFLQDSYMRDASNMTEEKLREKLEDTHQLYVWGLPTLDGTPNEQSLDERLKSLETSSRLILEGLSDVNTVTANRLFSELIKGLPEPTTDSIDAIVANFDPKKPDNIKRRANAFINAKRSEKVRSVLSQFMNTVS